MHTDHETNSINDKGWVLLFHVTEAFVSLKILTNGGLISLSFIRTHQMNSFEVKFSDSVSDDTNNRLTLKQEESV